MPQTSFSIIVPFYNAEPYIGACCEALVGQSVPAEEYEILMVDNNSTDRSAAIARSFSRVQVLEEKEQGAYAARNAAVAVAHGMTLAFTDPDCVPRQDWLERIGIGMADERVSILLGDRRFAHDEGVLGMLADYEAHMAETTFAGAPTECYYAYTNNMAVRSELAQRLGGFDRLQRGADSLFLQRALRLPGGATSVRYDPRMVVRHLEIASVSDYLEKKEIYGKVRAATRESGAPAALPFLLRARLAGRSMRGHSPWGCAMFCGALAAGAFRFEWAYRKSG